MTQLTPVSPGPAPAEGLRFRAPTVDDGAAMHALVKTGGVLEPNTCYAYLLLATHFADTCLVATEQGEVVAFVAAYRPPTHPDTVFVWQIGVHPRLRGRGVARRLLNELVTRGDGVRFLEATVDPANEPSRRLFAGFARHQGVPCAIGAGFEPHHFTTGAAGDAHPPEHLHRIGPFSESDPS
ncbi:MAG: diaminobutyrate acetyltransferase [Sandaracinus sp.]|nr:diaminobutyrate acetyltransferase [Sandaracinus sp.]|tara:strand:- start:1855 stop:2400 length:546 start_codon:yes stop_codon:yes gene_type:complete